ncbi:BPI2 domain-containing protein [Caenorhabditis elegans]|uniref:BPI2 domain-containing protein n=1 Tax=Caenorhabditis elegans TaxID=6239 RepID=Q9XV92_CAEEL|nr:BPI2 domain-containing protein [Caenorhabditis elegans]CAB04127.1 BPI2 domain-containing protein [Caenorhabditis elegans]|eukprot:NP_507564.1 Uncharacterized protein CELE_F16H6.9 [Caenorhabditis elegans]
MFAIIQNEIIERIVNLPADRNVEFIVTAYKQNAGHFTVLITVTGLRSVPIDIAFDVEILGNSALLTNAKQFNCQNAVSQVDQRKSVINIFLDSLLIAIRSRDATTISAFIDDKYIFVACERKFSKDEIVQRLVNRPADRTFDFDVKRIVEINEIYYLVDITVTGLRSVPIDIRFAVGVKENTILLVQAQQLHCPNNPNLVDKTKNLFVFLDSLLAAMRSRSASALCDLMTDSYIFEACERNVSKDKIIERIVNLPADRNVEFNITAYKENAGHFTVLITVTGLRSVQIDIAFDVKVKGNSALLTHAKQFNCQNAVSQVTQTKSVINDFLDQLLEAIHSRSPSAIGDLIYDKYIFEACDRTFSKEEIIQRLVNRPADREVEFDVIEVIELPEYYLVDITVTGLRSVPIDIRFGVAVAGNGGLLIHAKQFHCQKSVGQVDQKRQVLLVFLDSLLEAVRSRSATAMGALMSDSYYYNACERMFTKEQIIERMVQLPAHRNVDFNITSVKDKGEHFVVDITVTGVRSYPIAIAFKVAVMGNSALLIHAKQFNCHRKPFIEPLSHFDEKKDVITEFLDNFLIAVRHRFARSLGNIITDIFVYKSCEGNVSKEDFIKHIMSLLKTQRVDFDIQSVQETQDNYMVTIKVTGLYAEPVDILFEVTKYMRGTVVMLTEATQLHCS